MYVEKTKPGNNSGWKLKLIVLSSLFQINIKCLHLLTQEKPQLVVENNFTDKQVTFIKLDKGETQIEIKYERGLR